MTKEQVKDKTDKNVTNIEGNVWYVKNVTVLYSCLINSSRVMHNY